MLASWDDLVWTVANYCFRGRSVVYRKLNTRQMVIQLFEFPSGFFFNTHAKYTKVIAFLVLATKSSFSLPVSLSMYIYICIHIYRKSIFLLRKREKKKESENFSDLFAIFLFFSSRLFHFHCIYSSFVFLQLTHFFLLLLLFIPVSVFLWIRTF